MRATAACTFIFLTACTQQAPSAPQPQAAHSDVNPNAFIGTPREAAAKLNESIVLKENPDLAVRDGPSLAIRYREKSLVTYIDDPKGCDRYVIERAVKVRDPDTGRLEPIALVACHLAITTNRYLILPNAGKYPLTEDVIASPDGRHLATTDAGVTRARGAFIIIDWPNTQHRSEFPAGCKAVKWQDETHLTADCWRSDHPNTVNPYESDAVFFRAKIWRDDKTWHMQGTQWLDGETFTAKRSERPLPRLMAVNKTGVEAPE